MPVTLEWTADRVDHYGPRQALGPRGPRLVHVVRTVRGLSHSYSYRDDPP